MEKERITVVVPVYNTKQYLVRCVDSILKQTYSNLEILLVDDGSPDGAGQLCDQLAEQHEKIRVIHKENGGLSSARNAGIEQAEGTYISFVDSDDFIDPQMLERLYEMLKKHNADVSMVKYAEVSDSTFRTVALCEEIVYEEEQVEKAFLELKVESVCVGLYTKEIIGGLRFLVGKTSEDIPFNFMIFQKARKFVYLPEQRYFYYYNPESISNGKLDRNMFNYLTFRKEIYEHYADGKSELRELAETLYARSAMGLQARMALYGLTQDLDEKECRKCFEKVFRAHKKAFFKEQSVPFSRKIVAIAVFYFYNLVKIMRRMR